MDSPSRSHLSLFLLLFWLSFSSPHPTAADNFTLDSANFSLRNLTLLGDSYLRNGSIGLTRESGVPSSSSGTAICNRPVRLVDPATNLSASFSTDFSFSITNANPGSYGDGLAFFLSPAEHTLGDPGAYLGLFNNAAVAANGSVIAVEFDTRLDQGFLDSSSNHVGLDVNGPQSLNATDLARFAIDLKSGNLITAWIDYDDDQKTLLVYLAYSTVKPESPVISTRYDLSQHFSEFMYAGFSASTEGSTEMHTIESWRFQTFGLSPVNNASSAPISPSSPNNSWGVIPSINSSGSENVGLRNRKKLGLGLGLGIAGPVAFCVLFVVLLWAFIRMRLKERGRCFQSEILTGPRKFSYKELSVATRGFHGSRIVGNGAFGTVYRAIHPGTGIMYAVKRSKHPHQGKSEFMAELSIIAGLRHKNLVQLQGWCDDRGELFLVYEFMPNGSLDGILYHGQGQGSGGTCSMLGWNRRYNVAKGIASVLTYLHQECEQQVVHRDIKTSNIMLDASFNPRLGDFGLARLTDHDKSPVSTLTAGTMGYLAPEYLQYGKATEMTDVFSYGVVILEVCCGRRPIDKDSAANSQNLVNLVDWVWGLYAEDRLLEAADKRLSGEFNREEMVRLLLVGLSCTNPNFEERPSMRRVLQILNCEIEPVKVPRTKPCPTFSCSLPVSLHDIVSDGEQTVVSSPLYEVKID